MCITILGVRLAISGTTPSIFKLTTSLCATLISAEQLGAICFLLFSIQPAGALTFGSLSTAPIRLSRCTCQKISNVYVRGTVLFLKHVAGRLSWNVY